MWERGIVVKEWICQEEPLIRSDGASVGVGFRQMTELVRCKDCRWGDWSRNGKGEEMILCYNGDTGIEDGYLHEPYWLCAEGKRKEGR